MAVKVERSILWSEEPLKRTPLKRTQGLKSGGSLESRSELKRTPLKPRSDKRSKFMRDERVPLIKQMISDGRKCEVGPRLRSAGVAEASGCRGKIEGLHERRKRSSGGSLTNPDNLLGSCNLCNGLVEAFSLKAHEVGNEDPSNKLVVREGDPEWEGLGARYDL